MIHLDALASFHARFADCTHEPLHVTIHLKPNSQIVNYDPLHFDGLLARAVVEIATQGRGVADAEDGYWIPLPLKTLWESVEGFPLWAASTLIPVGPVVEDTYIRHKRNSEGFMHNKKKLVTRNGPWMERRIPTPMQVCDTYAARCIGNRAAIEDLLAHFTHIGKLRTARVERISVEPATYTDQDIYIRGGELLRPIPAEAGLIKNWPDRPAPVGWTPPFWKPSLFKPGWRTGARAAIDWYTAV